MQKQRERLLATIAAQPAGEALVTVDEFFDGNADLGSIGCNLVPHPGLDVFYRLLKSLEARADVSDVLLRICDVDEGDWPFSETVLVAGSIPLETLSELTEPLEPTELWVETLSPDPRRRNGLAGQVKLLWWD